MVFGFGKKEVKAQQATSLPVEEVLRLRQQGLNNNQIVQALQRNGYKMHQIFDAMNQADLRSAAPQEPPSLEPEPQLEPAPSIPEPAQGAESYGDERIEEIAEAIIEEKWNELLKDINKIIEWKNRTESRIEEVEKKISELKRSFEELHRAIVEKVSDYDKNITEVGTEIKAMENVFKKILPTLTSNVNELSRITKSLKKK
jgi:uncharacterized protein YoxC